MNILNGLIIICKTKYTPPKGLSECNVKCSISDDSLNSKSILLSLGNVFHHIISISNNIKVRVVLSRTGVTCCLTIWRIRFIDMVVIVIGNTQELGITKCETNRIARIWSKKWNHCWLIVF